MSLALFVSKAALLAPKISWMVWLVLPNCAYAAFRTTVKTDALEAASVGAVQVNDVPLLTGGAGHDQPAGVLTDWKSRVPLSTTFMCAVVPASGPLFVTVTV